MEKDLNIEETLLHCKGVIEDLDQKNKILYAENIKLLSYMLELFRLNYYNVFIADIGLGEMTALALLMGAYKDKINKKIAMIVYRESRANIMMACPFVDFVLVLDEKNFDEIKKVEDNNYVINFNDLYVKPKYLGRRHNDLRELVAAFIGLDYSAPFMFYETHGDARTVEKLYQDANLDEKKTVLIAPETNYFGNNVVPISFWEKLTNRLYSLGWKVLFNSAQEVIPGVPYAFLDLNDCVELSKRNGYVIGGRSGILDYISAFSNANVIGIFPNNDNEIWSTSVFPYRKSVEHYEEGHFAEHIMAEIVREYNVGRRPIINIMYDTDEKTIDAIMSYFH